MLVKLSDKVAVDKDEVSGVHSEYVSGQGTRCIVRMKNGVIYTVEEHPIRVMYALGLE